MLSKPFSRSVWAVEMADTMSETIVIRAPIGDSVERSKARRLANGRGRYTDDLCLPRMVYAAFVRSPYAHARIVSIDASAAARAPGAVRVFTGPEIAAIVEPWTGEAAHLPNLRSPPQYPMAVERALWQGEPVALVVATSRALAEDAALLVEVLWEELPAVTDPLAALEPDSPLVHPELGNNLAFSHQVGRGDIGPGFAEADHVCEQTLYFGRHTGVTLEPRGLIADYDPTLDTLTVHHSHQAPFQMQMVFARHLGIPEQNVRVILPDIGGGFGLKLHVYNDEVAVVAASKLLGRPVKYIADRVESLLTDIHARDHRVTAKIAIAADGKITGLSVDDICVIGGYSNTIRLSTGEGMLVLMFSGAPYDIANYQATLKVPFQNKNIIAMYRGVGQPIAVTVTEHMVDLAARAAGIDPVEMRRRNYLTDDQFPTTGPGGVHLEYLSLNTCLDTVVERMHYPALRTEQNTYRASGVYRGIGLATMVEVTAVGPVYYGPAEVGVSTIDGCTVKLEQSGKVRVITSITDQGQGTEVGIAQIVAAGLGVPFADVSVVSGDTAVTPYGGGAYASRGIAIGGEAAYDAARTVRDNALSLAAAILQADPRSLDIEDAQIRDADTGTIRMSLAELSKIGYTRQDTLPLDVQPELSATRSFNPKVPAFVANGIQASHVEVDTDTGFVTLLDHWVVADGGRLINPALVDGQIRGGVVQGLGAALFEHIVYDENGQMQTATLADYMVPMACEMPDIDVVHIETLHKDNKLGTKGAGEAGTIGAASAVLNAVNDALAPLGAEPIASLPITPEIVLQALGKVS